MFDAFVQFGDIKGECTDKDHKDWVTITRYEHEMTHPEQILGGRSNRGVEFAELKLYKMVDAASPKLYEACCKGTHLPEVTIEFCRSGGDPLKYFEIKLKEVLVSGVNEIGDANGVAKVPGEVVRLTFGAIEWTYTKQKPDGTAGGNVAAKWSLSRGAAA